MQMLDSRLVLKKTLNLFVVSLLFAIGGMFLIGPFIPSSLFLPLMIFEIGLLIFMFWIRKRSKISKGFLFGFTALTGVTSYPIIVHYLGSIGGTLVGVALVVTIVIMLALGYYSWKSNVDFTFLGGMLVAGLIALILVWIIFLFIPATTFTMWALTVAGILLFSGFVLYDISVIKNGQWEEDDIPLLALGLYLDFLNLFINILRAIGLISSND